MQSFELPDTSWRYRGVAMHNMRLWRHWNEICHTSFYSLLRPPPASQRRGSRQRCHARGTTPNDRHIRGYSERTCPPLPPGKTAESALLHSPLSTRLDEISLPLSVSQSEPTFGPFGPPGRPRGPLPPSNCAKIAGAGASPPPAPPPAPLRGARLAGPRPAQNPQEGGFSRITSYGRRVQLPCSE
jgi:hypothetical protein